MSADGTNAILPRIFCTSGKGMFLAVVPLVEREDAAPEACATYDDIEANFGAVLDCFKTLAHKPNSVEPVWKLYKILMMEGVLYLALQELAVLKISVLNQAEY